MNTVNWNNATIRNRVDHETPFVVLDCPDNVTIKLWSTPGGAYGPQVLALIYDGNTPRYTLTTGCGYSKQDAALETCFYELGRMPRDYNKRQDLYPYFVGGNYHRVTRKDWLKVK